MENENNYYNQPETGESLENQGSDVANQQTEGQPEQQSYGQPEQQTYGQSYGQANQQTYGQNMGYGMPPVGPNGQPLKNNYVMKLTFSILEIISC